MDNKDPKQETRRFLIAEIVATQLFPEIEKAEADKQQPADGKPEDDEKDKE